MKAFTLILSTFLFIIGLNAADGSYAEEIFFNGVIVTVNDKQPYAEALAVRNGRIIYIGNKEQVFKLKGDDTTMVDLEGNTLLPGFIDSDTNILAQGIFNQIVDLGPFNNKTMDDVIQVLKDQVQKGPVLAKGFDPNRLTKPESLDVVQLDAISKTVPILVIHRAGHTAYANTAALEQAQIKEATRPVGGTYGHDAEGRLNGIIYEVPAILTVVAPFSKTLSLNYSEIAAASLKEYARQGYTTVTDMGIGIPIPTSRDHINMLRDLANRSDAPVRVQGYVVYALLNQLKELQQQNNDSFHLNGVKIWADGSILGYTAALKDPYKGEKTLGKINFTQEELIKMVLDAVKINVQVAIHASGDQAISDTIIAFENAQNDRPNKDPRFRIEQASLADEAMLKKMAKVQASPAFTNLMVYFYGEVLKDKFLGDARANQLDLTKTALAQGLKISFSDNAPLIEINPLLMIQEGATRKIINDGVLNVDQAISIDEAIKALTIYPAWQSFREEDLGSIEVGKLADFVLLDKNPKVVDAKLISSIKVLKTFLSGKQVVLK